MQDGHRLLFPDGYLMKNNIPLMEVLAPCKKKRKKKGLEMAKLKTYSLNLMSMAVFTQSPIEFPWDILACKIRKTYTAKLFFLSKD